ncbi:MAG: hypothetical protein IPM94_07020 [bacterium]|nr:hypothetical protein [bacterium]
MRLLDHASEHVPRYHGLRSVVRNLIDHDKAADHGADNGTRILQSYLPCTTKAEIQGEPLAFRSSAQLGHLIRKTTGGSTGVPVTICQNPQRHALGAGCNLAWLWMAGIGIGDRQARF